MINTLMFLRLLLGLTFSFDVKEVDPKPLQFTIYMDSVEFRLSDYLVGMHSVYSSEPDHILRTAKYDQWLKESGVSTMRYPGGTIIKYWDWENPTGIMKGDTWDPGWDSSKNKPSKNWKSLDEYLATVEASGITPMFGVNITSGYQHDKVEESVARAVRMVNYVKEKGHGGAFWYLGNEGKNGGLESEANLFVEHARAMKEADPSIKCMFNHNNLNKNYLKKYLEIAGEYIDIAETHGKWPYGGNPKRYEPGTFKEWQVEKPLRDRKNHNRSWRTEADSLRKWASEFGRPDLLFANNEYGLGKVNNRLGFDKYTESLLVIDILQEHFIGNWYMTCYWSTLLRGNQGGVLDHKKGVKYNPMKYGFEMLAEAQGADFLKMTDDNNPSVYGFAAEKDGTLMIYLINKSDESRSIKLEVIGSGDVRMGLIKTLVNTEDQYGKIISGEIEVEHNAVSHEIPPMSYSMITLDAKR